MLKRWKKSKYSRPKRRSFTADKLFLVVLVLACLIVAVLTGCLPWATSSELQVAIIGFERTQGIDEVVFYTDINRTENTARGATYTVEVLVDGRVSDSFDVVVKESGAMVIPCEITGRGHAIYEMLNELDERYKAAKLRYEEYEEEVNWKGLFEGKMFDYDWMKRTERKLAELKTEVNKWQAWRNGDSSGFFEDFDRFCRKYVQLRIVREHDN